MELVHVKAQNPGINIYKVFYWSQGEKVEGLLTRPKRPRAKKYPVYVICHGGYTSSMPMTHVIQSSLGVPTPESVAAASSSEVVFEPEYRGYAESQGTVQGIYANAVDTENGITAIYSLSDVHLSNIKLLGVSMGGAVVLRVASDPKYTSYIRAVAAISPFIGWDAIEQWAEKNVNTNPQAQKWIQAATASGYGVYNANNKDYQQNSIDASKIKVPVLLLQGKQDEIFPWEATEMMYKEMKEDGDTVQLDLFASGNHGLTGTVNSQAMKDIQKWFDKY